MNPNKFDWDRDTGSIVDPALAAQYAKDRGQTFQQYAEEYAEAWPFDDEPPTDLVEGMVKAMKQAARAKKGE